MEVSNSKIYLIIIHTIFVKSKISVNLLLDSIAYSFANHNFSICNYASRTFH